MVDALMRLMNTDVSITGPMNLGNPVEHSMLDLAKTIVSILDREVLFQFKNSRKMIRNKDNLILHMQKMY